LQRRAMLLSLDSHAALGWEDRDAVRALALASLDRQPVAVTRRLASALREAGSFEEAASVLKLLRRGTGDAAQRTGISAELLRVERGRGKPWSGLAGELETFF